MSPPDPHARPQPSEAGAGARVLWAAAVVAVLVIAANIWLVVQAAEDQSHGAIAIAFMVGPVVNALMLAVSLVVTPLVRRLLSAPSMGLYVATCVGVPLAAVFVDFMVILAMPLHGS